MKNITFKTFTFGCRVNQAETAKIENDLIMAGLQLVKENQLSDIVIINTCVVTQKAEKEVRQLARRIKRENPDCFLVLCGCAVNYWQKIGFPELPVNQWVKNEKKERLADLIITNRGGKRSPTPLCGVGLQKKSQATLNFGRQIIKIQDGCNLFCSFCIVPYLRKKPTSKKISQIVKEVKKAERSGVREVILSGINLGLFGLDTNETIPQLLEEVLKKTSIPKISFGSIYPEVITNELIKVYLNDQESGNQRLKLFFHLPLQSGSKKVLKLMNRKFPLKKFKEVINKLHHEFPQALLATDVIVGFPGEGEKEFEETYKFLEEMPIFKFHVFRFSKRKGTLAYKMEKEWGRVNEKTKKIRSRILRQLGEKKYQHFLRLAKPEFLL